MSEEKREFKLIELDPSIRNFAITKIYGIVSDDGFITGNGAFIAWEDKKSFNSIKGMGRVEGITRLNALNSEEDGWLNLMLER